METRLKDLVNSIGLLLLRLGMGGYMLTHGWGKLQMLLAGDAGTFGDPLGLGGALSLVLVTVAEFFAALLVIFGFATRLSALTVVIAMGVAAFVVHANDPWTMQEGAKLFKTGASKSWASKEPALLYFIPFFVLIFTGPGIFSVDNLIWPWWKARQTRRKAAAGLVQHDTHFSEKRR